MSRLDSCDHLPLLRRFFTDYSRVDSTSGFISTKLPQIKVHTKACLQYINRVSFKMTTKKILFLLSSNSTYTILRSFTKGKCSFHKLNNIEYISRYTYYMQFWITTNFFLTTRNEHVSIRFFYASRCNCMLRKNKIFNRLFLKVKF